MNLLDTSLTSMTSFYLTLGSLPNTAAGHSGRQNDEKMPRKIGNAQSHATFFRHSAFLSLPAVVLRKLSSTDETTTTRTRYHSL